MSGNTGSLWWRKSWKPTPCDFIGFQEVNHFQAEFLTRSLMRHGHIGWYNKGVKWWQNNLTLFDASWECLGHRHFFLSHPPDIPSRLPGSRWTRQCVIGWFKKNNRYLFMANIHFDSTTEVQQKSAGLVMEFFKRFPQGMPQIITGDLNTTPGSPWELQAPPPTHMPWNLYELNIVV